MEGGVHGDLERRGRYAPPLALTGKLPALHWYEGDKVFFNSNTKGKPMEKQENGRIVETAVEARGAERGPTIRNVLVMSMALLILAFAIIYFIFFKT